MAPARELADALGITVGIQNDELTLNAVPIHSGNAKLPDGSRMMAIRDLELLGGSVTWDKDAREATCSFSSREAIVHQGEKRVEIHKDSQKLLGFQGTRVVLETPISTGKIGHRTPNGNFRSDWKERMHISKLYDDAPMPWSVHVYRDIFLHGYTSVPSEPASHGCIRLPMTGINPAKWLWNWIEPGTPVTVSGAWRD
jgi:lipoprotein-anchoring transpeptidase ErfK/SrfK